MTIQTPKDPLDTLLTSHLTATLEPQRGRALAAFRQHLDTLDIPAPIPLAKGTTIPRRALWAYAGIPSLLAACVAVAITLQFVPTPPNARNIIDVSHTTPIAFESLDQYETSRDLNAGMATLDDNTPVRLIRRQSLRHTEWTDPNDKAHYSVTEPIEKVGYIRVNPY